MYNRKERSLKIIISTNCITKKHVHCIYDSCTCMAGCLYTLCTVYERPINNIIIKTRANAYNHVCLANVTSTTKAMGYILKLVYM